jgi:PTH2 family peptidyl-tRNA hydrolase
MPTGKLAAQAGHAYTDALLDCLDKRPDLVDRYRRGDNAGSKATLKAKNEAALMRAYDDCMAAGLPCALVIDENHILLPHFDGSPIVTALGIGPISRIDAKPIVKRFNCV